MKNRVVLGLWFVIMVSVSGLAHSHERHQQPRYSGWHLLWQHSGGYQHKHHGQHKQHRPNNSINRSLTIFSNGHHIVMGTIVPTL